MVLKMEVLLVLDGVEIVSLLMGVAFRELWKLEAKIDRMICLGPGVAFKG